MVNFIGFESTMNLFLQGVKTTDVLDEKVDDCEIGGNVLKVCNTFYMIKDGESMLIRSRNFFDELVILIGGARDFG